MVIFVSNIVGLTLLAGRAGWGRVMFRVRHGGTGGGLCCRTERKLVGNMGAGCGRGASPSELSFFFRFFDEILNFCAALQQKRKR